MEDTPYRGKGYRIQRSRVIKPSTVYAGIPSSPPARSLYGPFVYGEKVGEMPYFLLQKGSPAQFDDLLCAQGTCTT